MGILRDAAVEIVKETLIVGGIGALAGAAEKIEEMSAKSAEKKERKISNRFKITSFLSRYNNHLLAICSEKDGKRTYVFSTTDNQIKYFTSCPNRFSGILLHDYDENVIGSVTFGMPKKSGLLLNKHYSRLLSLNIGNSQIGTVELAITGGTKGIKIHSYFWDIWMKAGENSVESDKEFKMSPMDIFAKKAYQIGFNDEGKELILALTFIAVKEAKQILKEVRL